MTLDPLPIEYAVTFILKLLMQKIPKTFDVVNLSYNKFPKDYYRCCGGQKIKNGRNLFIFLYIN